MRNTDDPVAVYGHILNKWRIMRLRKFVKVAVVCLGSANLPRDIVSAQIAYIKSGPISFYVVLCFMILN